MRRILVVVLALLLLSLQHGALVHPIAHLASQISRAQDTGLTPPEADQTCAECALLSAGGNALGGEQRHLRNEPPATSRAAHVIAVRVADAPAWFQSRAPPVLL